jgi:hypothetical protein
MKNKTRIFSAAVLSNDGKYYIAARLAITHRSLPKGDEEEFCAANQNYSIAYLFDF